MQERVRELKAHAKINWALAITGRRPDGYHLLQTVFQSISLADDIRLTLSSPSGNQEPEIRCLCRGEAFSGDSEFDKLSGPHNLVCKAAKLFGQASVKKGILCPTVTIEVHKRIPLQAGLAGGSSDAAAVLCGLNSMMDHVLSEEELYETAGRCGADTPFCLGGGTQWAEGKGDELTPLPEARGWPLVLVKPTSGISTERAFAAYDALPEGLSSQPVYGKTEWRHALTAGDKSRVAQMMNNSLEKVSMDICPEIAEIKAELVKAGCIAALMSGSGSAVFGLAENTDQANIVQTMRQKGFTNVWAVQTAGCSGDA